MGMNTELVLACEMQTALPDQVVDTLKYLLGADKDVEKLDEQARSLFNGHYGLLMCASYYFPGKATSTLVFDTISEAYHLMIRMNTKNIGNTIEEFLFWLAPYSVTEGFVGYMRNEISEHPTLLYFKEGSAFYHRIPDEDITEFVPIAF